MRDKTGGSEAVWREEELSAAALPDKRLARRLRRLLDQMSAEAGKPVPGGLRRLGGDEGGLPLLRQPAGDRTWCARRPFRRDRGARRGDRRADPHLAGHDGVYSRRARPGKIGFTKTINAGRYKAGQPNVLTLCGVLMRSSLAVTLTGTPLGLTAVKFWTRTKFKGTLALKRHVNPTRVPIETKESYRLAGKPAPIHRASGHALPSAGCMW